MNDGLCTTSRLNVLESLFCLDGNVRLADAGLISVDGATSHIKVRGSVFAPLFWMTPPAFIIYRYLSSEKGEGGAHHSLSYRLTDKGIR